MVKNANRVPASASPTLPSSIAPAHRPSKKTLKDLPPSRTLVSCQNIQVSNTSAVGPGVPADVCNSPSLDCRTRLETVASDTQSVPGSLAAQSHLSLNHMFLQKVELTAQNAEVNLAGCSFKITPSHRFPLSSEAILQRKLHLRNANSFVDADGSLLDVSDFPGSSLSPYLVAYRRKIKKIRSPTIPEIVLTPSVVDLHTEQTTFCSCKTSNCLKLYCDCFKSLGVCGPSCRCEGCKNRPEDAPIRMEALNKSLTSTYGKLCFKAVPSASESQLEEPIATSQPIDLSSLRKEDLFCRCKKSNCGNNYCSCHSNGKRCSDRCRCSECHNSG